MRDQLATQLDELKLLKDENWKLKLENQQLRDAASGAGSSTDPKAPAAKPPAKAARHK